MRLLHPLLISLLLQLMLLQPGRGSSAVCGDVETCEYPYIIVIDAGSTGTRAHVFKFRRLKNRTPKVELLMEESSNKFKPVIDSFVNSLERVRGHLEPLINFAKAKIPVESHSSTAFFMGSTAGVRQLTFPQRLSLMRAAADEMKRTPFITRYNNFAASMVISGTTEGLLAWSAVNFLLGRFENDRYKRDTYGMLDLGGGSTQIAVRNPDAQPMNDPFDYLRHRDAVISRSYLGLGKSAATLKILGYNEANPQPVYTTICLNDKFSGSFSFGNVSVKVAGKMDRSELGRYHSCGSLAEPLIKNTPHQMAPEAPVYVAVSGFFHVIKSLVQEGHLKCNLADLCRINFLEFSEAGWQACNKTLTKGEFKPYLCLDSSYIGALLVWLHGFEMNQVLLFADKIKIGTVAYSSGWPLGLALAFAAEPSLISAVF